MQEYFTPINLKSFSEANQYTETSYGKCINAYLQGNDFPSLENIQLAIIGVEEDRKALNNEGCGLAPNYVRENLYKLFQGNYTTKIVDLGNIKKGNSIDDSYFAVSDVISQLLKKNIIPIIIGGGQDIT